ncbi:hypothetical protein WS88_28770 [Burkholderia cepacia]|nr:hypothetical protein WS88_28770 [Burkholderia cepacia]
MIASAVAGFGYRAGQLVGPAPKSCAAKIDAAFCGAFGKVFAKQLPTGLLAGHAEAATPYAQLTFKEAC